MPMGVLVQVVGCYSMAIGVLAQRSTRFPVKSPATGLIMQSALIRWEPTPGPSNISVATSDSGSHKEDK